MKSVSYDDEKKWERLQRMRKASKKKSVRDKVDEEVGISSTVEMEKAKKEAALRRKEQQAVDKEKKALKKEEVVVERLGGKGTSRKAGAAKIHPTSGDWPDSDRGAGNRAKKRAGGKVEKKSPTYLAHVHNKEEVEIDEGLGAAYAVGGVSNAIASVARAWGANQAAKGAIIGGALSGAGSLAGGALSYAASINKNK